MHNHNNSLRNVEQNEQRLRPSEQFLRDMEVYQSLSDQGKEDFLATFDTLNGWKEPTGEIRRSEVSPRTADSLGATALNSLKEDTSSTEKSEVGELDRRTELFDFLRSQDISIKTLPVVAALWSSKKPNPRQSIGNQTVVLNSVLGKTDSNPDEFMLGTTYVLEQGNPEWVRELALRDTAETVATMPAQRTYKKRVNEKVREQLTFGRTREKIVTRVKEFTEIRTMGDYLGTDDDTPAWLIGYQVNTTSSIPGQRRALASAMNRSGAQYAMQIAMPEEQARVLTEWLKEDPRRARELADYTLTDVIDYKGGYAPKISYTDRIKAVRFTGNPRGAVQGNELVPIDRE